jgi:hypothetical protein
LNNQSTNKKGHSMKEDSASLAMDASLRAKSGKGFADWIEIARKTGHEKHKALVDHLKTAHSLTHGYANAIALRTFGSDAGSIDPEALMSAMFAGPKLALRPIYDQLVAITSSFGGDVMAIPKKGYVSIRRSKQFAIAQPSTKDRFDLGLNLKGVEHEGRLELSGSFNTMVSHRVRITTPEEVDDTVVAWLRAAYDRA